MRKFFLATIFIVFTHLTLTISLFGLLQFSRNEELKSLVAQQQKQVLGAKSPLELYSALPKAIFSISQAVTSSDARPVIIRNYLEKYNSPMLPYADFIVKVSDKYGLDYRLLVAIAQQESNLGKKIPPNSYNAWGWGVHSQGTLKFSSWEEGIETVAKGLKEDYIDKGYNTPEKIMKKYTPLSKGSWAFGVKQFLQEMDKTPLQIPEPS